MDFHAVDVVGVRVEMPSNQPIVLLKEMGGDRYLPIWVGAVEATAIAFAQQGVEPPRPLTHDLMKEMLDALGRKVDSVHLTELRDGVFYSLINIDQGVTISSRPSDAIALYDDSQAFIGVGMQDGAELKVRRLLNTANS